MYYDDHAPPHFHAYYGEDAVVIEIDPVAVRNGYISGRALAMALEWAGQHRIELLENWRRAEAHLPLLIIPPLE